MPSASADAAAPGDSLIIIIDHAGAEVYAVDRSADDAPSATAYDPRRLLHHLGRKIHGGYGDDTRPDDERFFDRIARAVSAGGEIVVVGHGKGLSHETKWPG